MASGFFVTHEMDRTKLITSIRNLKVNWSWRIKGKGINIYLNNYKNVNLETDLYAPLLISLISWKSSSVGGFTKMSYKRGIWFIAKIENEMKSYQMGKQNIVKKNGNTRAASVICVWSLSELQTFSTWSFSWMGPASESGSDIVISLNSIKMKKSFT